MIKQQNISIVYLNRDLRLEDHAALSAALAGPYPVLLIYNSFKTTQDLNLISERHDNFVKQTLIEMTENLRVYDTEVCTVNLEPIQLIKSLMSIYVIARFYYHFETELYQAHQKRLSLFRFLKNNNVAIFKFHQNGLFQEQTDLKTWKSKWSTQMKQSLKQPDFLKGTFVSSQEIEALYELLPRMSLEVSGPQKYFQAGGQGAAHRALSRFKSRVAKSYSRLSPYLSFGVLSVRMVYQSVSDISTKLKFRKSLEKRCYQIQLFENYNLRFDFLLDKRKYRLKSRYNEQYAKAWNSETTGFPLIDAAMHNLNKTGYLSIVHRRICVYFFTHILKQPWQDASAGLSPLFLDYHPGVHFTQVYKLAHSSSNRLSKLYDKRISGDYTLEDRKLILQGFSIKKRWHKPIIKLKNSSNPNFALS